MKKIPKNFILVQKVLFCLEMLLILYQSFEELKTDLVNLINKYSLYDNEVDLNDIN